MEISVIPLPNHSRENCFSSCTLKHSKLTPTHSLMDKMNECNLYLLHIKMSNASCRFRASVEKKRTIDDGTASHRRKPNGVVVKNVSQLICTCFVPHHINAETSRHLCSFICISLLLSSAEPHQLLISTWLQATLAYMFTTRPFRGHKSSKCFKIF